jgi:uncharacterized protein (DUF362 family)
MSTGLSRRELFPVLAGAALAARPRPAQAAAPTAPVAVAKCKTYGSELMPTVQDMFDQIGGLGKIVKGKTVAIKLNLNGGAHSRVGYLPLENTHFPHPNLIGSVLHLMDRAGARRIRLLESTWTPNQAEADSLEEHLIQSGWDPAGFCRIARNVEFENTNSLGKGKSYVRFKVPWGGTIYPAYDLNHSYAECDVLVSIGKPKDHSTTGVTLAIKNMFGITPLTIYGPDAPQDEPGRVPSGHRMDTLHYGKRKPPKSAPQEIDPNSSRDDGYRLPNIIVELTAARPMHLAIQDGILSMAGGQNPGPMLEPVAPGFLVVGTNPVCADAVTMALMNYDPMAERGQVPFEVPCDNTLKIAEEHGLGTRDLGRIEVIGTPIREAMFDFKTLRAKRAERRRRQSEMRRKENPVG